MVVVIWIGLLALAATPQAGLGAAGAAGGAGDAVLGLLLGGAAATGLPRPLADGRGAVGYDNTVVRERWLGMLASGEPRLLHSGGDIAVSPRRSNPVARF